MKIEFNPTNGSSTSFSMTTVCDLINDNVESYFGNNKKTSADTYVVFDGTAKVLCEGTLEECFCYYEMYYKYQGFHPALYSREMYNEMMKVVHKEYKY